MSIVLLVFTVLCAVFAVRASRILVAILWLALVSVLTSLLLYLVGAWSIAVIELSVGTGLATVLMVFAIAMIGDEHELVHLKPFPLLVMLLMAIFICLLTIPFISSAIVVPQEPIQTILWHVRGLDILPQIGLIFVSMLGVLALLNERRFAESTSHDNSEKVTNSQTISQDSRTLAKQDVA